MGFLEIKDLGKIHYHEFGSGNKLLFAFHGYGMSGANFNVFEQSLLKQFRIVSFDHFFHGTSYLYDVNEASVIAGMQPEMLKTYITTWFEQFGEERFSLLGYSIGANLALYLVTHFAPLIDELILLAPDGLVPHKGFQFLRASFIGQKLFRKLTYSDWMMSRALKFLQQIKVIDQTLYAIAHREIDTPDKRIDAYFTIHFLKHIRPDIEQIAGQINRYHIRCRLYFGEFDDLFPTSNGRKLISLLSKPELYVVPMGHWMITQELDNFMARQIA
jgi:pimeloyl-ACP methyl ester carboxylesterase